MQSGVDSVFQAGSQAGPSLRIELVSAHGRVGGSINLGSYTRLSDLLNFHDEILAVTDAVVLNRSGIATADGAPQLDIRLDGLTIVVDHSDYVPPPDSSAVEKKAHRMLAVTQAHVITATFFIYPSAEPDAYLRAQEPRWVPLANVRIRSVVDRRIRFQAQFAVLNRKHVIATSVI
jgi:hypothetical protein